MRKTRSSILEAVHETARGLHDAKVMDTDTARGFEQLRERNTATLDINRAKLDIIANAKAGRSATTKGYCSARRSAVPACFPIGR